MIKKSQLKSIFAIAFCCTKRNMLLMHTELFVKLLERVQIDLNDLKMVISIKNASDALQLWKKKTMKNTSINLHHNNFFLL